MGEYKPLVVFLLLSTLLHIFMYGSYAAFDKEIVVPNETGPVVTLYLTFEGLFNSLETWIDEWSLFGFDIPWLSDIFIMLVNIVTLGLFTEVISDIIIIWATIPFELFILLGVPLMIGAVYAVVKALPST